MSQLTKKLIIANWKMHKTIEDSIDFLNGIEKNLSQLKYKLVICPPFTAINAMKLKAHDLKIDLGVQNCFYEDEGAYTGEISPKMAANAGAGYVILGHSERRNYFCESNNIINKKICKAIENKLKVVLCVGEDLRQRQNKTEIEFIVSQIKECLSGINKELISSIIIAYEPIWAIGTGKSVIPQDAERIATEIKKFVFDFISHEIFVLYGGSVTAENHKEFLNLSSIDGVLIGGASLSLKSFLEIITH